MQLDLKEVNEILEYFENADPYCLDQGKVNYNSPIKYTLIEKILVKEHTERQDYQGQTDYIFKIKDTLYVKVSAISDSYGDFDTVQVRFVAPREITKTEFENI